MSHLQHIKQPIRGPQGLQGPQGPVGPQGKSAYDIWLQAGNVGTIEDFLASLVCPPLGSIQGMPAILVAWQPELDVVLAAASAVYRTFAYENQIFHDIQFGTKRTLLVKGGTSSANTAMIATILIKDLKVTSIIMAGIGGAMDGMNVGDVTIPDRWALYQESVLYAAQISDNPPVYDIDTPRAQWGSFLFMAPRTSEIYFSTQPGVRHLEMYRYIDPGMMALAQTAIQTAPLQRCDENVCLPQEPEYRMGGTGMTAPINLQNLEYRTYLHQAFDTPESPLRVHDQESAVLAHVGESLGFKRIIVVRTASDYAGGPPDIEPWDLYLQIASTNMVIATMAISDAL